MSGSDNLQLSYQLNSTKNSSKDATKMTTQFLIAEEVQIHLIERFCCFYSGGLACCCQPSCQCWFQTLMISPGAILETEAGYECSSKRGSRQSYDNARSSM